ncbi:unnamed protein product [Echinostoma caproni]|uniref:PDZ domain-containing protein n=1 Tax=Echinostoma caproni TaxID=27848 RepID=A0A183B505_9TREM|nr:unnamed protein product [Echinostoma caproni]
MLANTNQAFCMRADTSSVMRPPDELFESSTSDENRLSRSNMRGQPRARLFAYTDGPRMQRAGRPEHNRAQPPHHRSWSNLIAPGQHLCSWHGADDQWGNLADTLDLSNDYSTSNETITGPRGRVDRSRVRETRPVSGVESDSTSRIRSVRFQIDPHRGTGMSLVGGNLTGVFVSSVQPDSVADQAGIGEADQLMKINGLDLTEWTKEEVALALIAEDGPVVLELRHDPVAYVTVRETREACDSMYVRAYFTLWPNTAQTPRAAQSEPGEISISEGDIFHVVDTFVDGVFGNWLCAVAIARKRSKLGHANDVGVHQDGQGHTESL